MENCFLAHGLESRQTFSRRLNQIICPDPAFETVHMFSPVSGTSNCSTIDTRWSDGSRSLHEYKNHERSAFLEGLTFHFYSCSIHYCTSMQNIMIYHGIHCDIDNLSALCKSVLSHRPVSYHTLLCRRVVFKKKRWLPEHVTIKLFGQFWKKAYFGLKTQEN